MKKETNKKSPSKKNFKGKIEVLFKPKQVTKRLLQSLPVRARDIISGRFGLNGTGHKMTLESIGKKYGITRERVRQIENYSINVIKKSKEYQKENESFAELKDIMTKLGGIISEDDLLNYFSKDREVQSHVHFMLVVGESFSKEKEDSEFKHRWHIDKNLANKIHESLKKLYSSLSDDELVSEPEMVSNFLEYIKDLSEEHKNEEIIKRWLSISKNIGRNPLGEWGKAKSSNVNAKGMKDYAYLIIRRHGSPIHFREVARLITEVFNKKAHVATTHNELIKDPRFVLVGRGLYALKEWGYSTGVVRDVIKEIIEKRGPLPK